MSKEALIVKINVIVYFLWLVQNCFYIIINRERNLKPGIITFAPKRESKESYKKMINKRYDFYYRSEEKWQTSKLMLGKRIKLPVYLSGILCHQTMSRMLGLANRYNHHLVWASANTLLFYFQQFPSPALQKLSDKNANWNITNYLESLMDSWVVKTFRKMEK